MTIQDWCAIIVAVLGVLSGIIGVIVAINRVYIRITLVENKLSTAISDIDTLQIYLLKRGAEEAVQKKLGTLNSPLVFHSDVVNQFMGLTVANDIRKFVKTSNNVALPDPKLAFEIEKKFGNDIIKQMCVPMGVTMGACLLMVLDIAKNERRISNLGHNPERRVSH
jgi:hypothetical protein